MGGVMSPVNLVWPTEWVLSYCCTDISPSSSGQPPLSPYLPTPLSQTELDCKITWMYINIDTRVPSGVQTPRLFCVIFLIKKIK